MNYPEIYRSKVYEGFKEIEPEAWREIIQFFEENEKRIKKLEFEEYFEVLIGYINALFEGEKLLKHLEIVDLLQVFGFFISQAILAKSEIVGRSWFVKVLQVAD